MAALPQLYVTVTANILEEMSKGRLPWQPGFDKKKAAVLSGMPRNGKTGRSYNGINVLILWSAAMVRGFTSHKWLTFHQAKEVGAKVRKGEKATIAVYANTYEVEVETDTGPEKERRPVLRAYPLFNLGQLDGVPNEVDVPAIEPATAYAGMKAFAEGTGIPTTFGGNQPRYTPSIDRVFMPHASVFDSEPEFYSLWAHELVHASGAKHRLNRDLSTRFGSEQYAMEELVAEMGAAFLCAEHAVEPTTKNHAAYLQSWMKVLKADNRAIFSAASKASEASNYLLTVAAENKKAA